MKLPDRLPKPDNYGHYWLGDDKLKCSVILKAGSTDRAPANAHGFFASRGIDGGILFNGSLIQYFDTPLAALDALKEI